jgi:hypothetical protein
MGEKHKITVHGAPRAAKVYIQRGAALFPKGIVNDTAITTSVPCSLQHCTFYLDWGRPQPGLAACGVVTLYRVPFTPVTDSHVTQSIRIHVTLRCGRGVRCVGGIRNGKCILDSTCGSEGIGTLNLSPLTTYGRPSLYRVVNTFYLGYNTNHFM